LLKVKVEDTSALRFILEDDLYLLNEDKSLYAAAPQAQPEIQTQQPVFNYLGANKKSFLILTSYTGHEFIKEDHLAALESVLGRIGLTREDVAIFNVPAHGSVAVEQMMAYFAPKKLVILGKSAVPPGMTSPLFNVIEKKGNISTLYTFSFDEMMSSNENKRAFWDQIKSL
jgi:hypothetical protein